MMLAELGQTTKVLVVVATCVVMYGLLGFLILKGIRWFGAASYRSQLRMFQDVAVYDAPAPGLVGVVFHTYSGLFVFVQQVEHRFWATPADARKILARLNRYNLTRGFFAYGALVVPLLSLGNYFAQKRSIEQQEAEIQLAD